MRGEPSAGEDHGGGPDSPVRGSPPPGAVPSHPAPGISPLSSRVLPVRRELARKAIHLTTAVAPVAYAAGFERLPLATLLGLALAVALAVELGRVSHAGTRGIFQRTAGPLLREHEHARWAGATWLFLAFLGAVLLLPPAVAVAAMWAVAAGDAAAAVVGRAVGRHRVWGSGKTIEGSAACWAATFAGALLLAALPLAESVVAASAATLAELPARPGDDNVRIIAAVGGGILLWRLLIGP